MQVNDTHPFGAPARWQTALAMHGETFSCLSAGSRIGLVPEAAVGGSAVTGSAMLVWQATGDGVTVATEPFSGFEKSDVDILIAVDETALASLREALGGDVVASLRREIRDGHVLFFARKQRRVLEESGYEDLLDQLGFAFMGVCR